MNENPDPNRMIGEGKRGNQPAQTELRSSPRESGKSDDSALQDSQERYRQLFEWVNDAIFLRRLSEDGSTVRFLEVNGIACQRLGYSRAELLQLTPADIDPYAKLEEIQQKVKDLPAGEGVLFETVHVAKDGRQIPVEINSRVVEWEGNRMVLSVARDLRERKAAEAVLRESERRFRQMLESVSLCALMLDPNGRILFINPYLLQLTGWTLDEVLGGDWFQRFVPADRRRTMRELLESLKEGLAVSRFESEILTRDGKRRLIAWNNSSICDAGGRLLGLTSLGEDITERRLLEEQFQQAQKMEAVGQLAGGVAHDFNNILAATLLHLGLLQYSTPLPASVKEVLAEIEGEITRAANLTRQLLLFSRRQVARFEPVDLTVLVGDLLKMLRRLLGEHIKIVLESRSESAWVKGDAGMLEQVLMNLCVNARDAMPRGGKLTLLIETLERTADAPQSHVDARPGRFVCLSVLDTGCGMPPAVLERIFEPFFTTKEIGKGTGLGLATVFGIIKQHKGWIEVSSEINVGTTFRIFLPAQPKPDQHPSGPRDLEQVPSGSETLLLVEDEPSLRASAVLCLRKLGYAVLEASHGAQALEIWRQHQAKIDLLLTDQVMPDTMTGLELAERLRLDRPDLPVILSSGYSDEMGSDSPATLEGLMFIAKPYRAAPLARLIRRCLDASRSP